MNYGSQIASVESNFLAFPNHSLMDDCVAIFPEDIVKEILLRRIIAPLQLLIYDNGDIDDDSCPMTLISKEKSQTFLGMKYLIGYVYGLFLMYGEINSAISYALWNPATKEVRPLHLPAPIIDDSHNFGTHGEFQNIEGFDKPPPFDKEVRHTYGTAYLNVVYYRPLS
ncbi:hypothetical protein H5410_042015 [Solanum commersonii]|uniref:Uncharacterized protein n=1 Tax=Solanum commersonii TaxID=4109 RepID=A0A9J5XUI9_SOLCO|nr:hypothetical protein H5410_042015 [Solanum commersonii]